MGKHLAKLPQQRIRAPENHPSFVKLEKLFDFMDKLGLEFRFDIDRVYVIDSDRPNDCEWEIRDIINSDFLVELPCDSGEYKLTCTTDISPRPAQSAPQHPVNNTTPASGLNHYRAKPVQAKPKKRRAVTQVPSPLVPAAQALAKTPSVRVISKGKK